MIFRNFSKRHLAHCTANVLRRYRKYKPLGIQPCCSVCLMGSRKRKRDVHNKKLKNIFLRGILKLRTRNIFIAVYRHSANPVYLSNMEQATWLSSCVIS